MSDALTSALSQDVEKTERTMQRLKIFKELKIQIDEIIWIAVKTKEYDKNKIENILLKVDKTIQGRDGKYHIKYFDEARIKLLGVILYCERYRKKSNENIEGIKNQLINSTKKSIRNFFAPLIDPF